MNKTIKCDICGKPYVFYAFVAGDQSACPQCIQKARNKNSWGPNAPVTPKKPKVYNEHIR